jgi:hypothetical protein
MAQDEQRTGEASVQQDLPAKPDAETREETIARVVGEEEAVGAEHGGSPDPSTRRGVQRTLAGTVLVFAGVGAIIGAVLGVALSFWPGPTDGGRGLGVEGDGLGHTLGYGLVMAIGIAIIAGVIAAFLTLAREDGRVERQVEQKTGRGPEGPGDPASPEHDLKPR